MATRYWVGGAGNWSSTTKWSLTSGGASGASVPISTDDVVFDANSGLVNAVATVDTAQTCATLTLTPGATIGFSTIAITASLTVTGLFSMSGTAGNQRFFIRGTTYGIATNFVVGSASGLSDLDFRDLFVTGTAAPLSGTRIGNRTGVTGVTFSTPKTVYWNLAGAQNWSANGWAATSGGTPAVSNFPLAQDTAVFDNAGSAGTVTTDSAIPYMGTVDMSARTTAFTFFTSITPITVYGDWKNGSGASVTGTGAITFSGRNTQTITSAGVAFSMAVNIDSFGGVVQLADAINLGTANITAFNGTFTTNNFSVTAGGLLTSGATLKTINLGASTLNLGSTTPTSGISNTNTIFNAGTSTINLTSNGSTTFNGGVTYYNVNFTDSTASVKTITGSGTVFNNLTFTAPASAGLMSVVFNGNSTITGTLTCAGASAVRRVFLQSNIFSIQRTHTVGTLSAQDCDFRDTAIAGTASGSSPTRAGNCGGNSGITFPASKTVYWNLAGAQNWSATGWATSSGGTPAINNFPLAQDTAVFDNTGSVTGAITINAAWNIGTFDASLRTSAMTLSVATNAPNIYGNWLFGTGVTHSVTGGSLTFSNQSTQTITSNSVQFGCDVFVQNVTGVLQLADALSINTTKSLSFNIAGTFDAVTYNVTTGSVSANVSGAILKMGSGTWTLTAASSCWNLATITLYKGTANIVLSDTTTTARTFAGGGLSYNKLTIGGTTGTSTLTFSGNNQFTELASTKTVAHTIDIGTNATTQTVGAWTVTGTAGNIVTLANGGTIIVAGARVSGVDYLALGTTTLSSTSPGEFYAGANSTGGTNFILTAAPAATTRYWVGGTGTWDATTTTNWSTSSGGAGGASVPTSADAVVFDSLSNATAYTVTCTATQLRCGSFTMSGPLAGNVTWAGTAPLAIHGNVTLSATGITRTFSGALTLSGSSTGKTFTTNGVTVAGNPVINGIGCGWVLGSAWSDGGAGTTLTVTNGSFDTANYNVTIGALASSNSNARTISLGSSAISIQSLPIGFTNAINLTFNAGTSTVTCTNNSNFNGGGLTFYNVSFTAVSSGTFTIFGSNTFNNLSVTGLTSAGLKTINFSANQIINGTLTLSASTNGTMRTFVQSDTLGTPRTLTVAAFAAGSADIDFRDITIAGAAAPISGTRFGDCKGNTGITFPTAKTVYWNSGAVANAGWSAAYFALTIGGATSAANFPLAQDTFVVPSSSPASGGSITIDNGYNVGTFDASARTANTIAIAHSSALAIHGNWVNGTGVTSVSGTGTITFAGRIAQTITSAGSTFSEGFVVNSPSGSVTLQDSYTNSFSGNVLVISLGTFNANGYNVSLTGSLSAMLSNGTGTRTVNVGSGTWTIASITTGWQINNLTGVTVSGTGTISMTGASAKTFQGGGTSYSGITLNQGGAGALTISNNNTFKNITNTYSATGATTINFAATTTTVLQFTAAGTAGNLLTISGTSAASPATLIYSGGGNVNVGYLTVNNVRGYPI